MDFKNVMVKRGKDERDNISFVLALVKEGIKFEKEPK